MVYLLLYFDASGFLRLGLLAAVLHELGHILVYCIQQRHLPVIEVTMTGFCMRTAGERLSPRQRFVLAVAGPAVNFALAAIRFLRSFYFTPNVPVLQSFPAGYRRRARQYL